MVHHGAASSHGSAGRLISENTNKDEEKLLLKKAKSGKSKPTHVDEIKFALGPSP